jgi:predicted dehydrogenase
MSAPDPLRVVVVGVRGMGRQQAKLLAGMPEYRLEAVCDLDAATAQACAAENGVSAYQDFSALLVERKPDVAAICTPNSSHASLTIQAARAGVRGVLCEKPMAVNLADARAMVAACAEAGTSLVVNHQRRVGADLRVARRLIESGAIGEVLEWRGFCAGDMLSDGTHAVDSLLWLAGDPPIRSVAGQVDRRPAAASLRNERPGFRYGHPVETGAWGLLTLEEGNRIEIFCGSYRGRTAYQEYEVIGTRGRLWRVGDRISPNLFIQDAGGGEWESVFDGKLWHAVPAPAPGGRGLWRAVPESVRGDALAEGYRLLARSVREGAPHPMAGAVALKGFEGIMAIYESARLGRTVDLPLAQERFPLELMIAEGRA